VLFVLSAATVPDEFRLIRDLLRKYEQTARPRHDSADVVTVVVRFSLQQIYDLVSRPHLVSSQILRNCHLAHLHFLIRSTDADHINSSLPHRFLPFTG
jgi:hypothetical protein